MERAVRILRSFEEADASGALERAAMTPQQRVDIFSKFVSEPETKPLSRDLREFVECLNSNKVEYLIVGALAVSCHGYPRYSADVDLLIRPTPENAQLVLNALRPPPIRLWRS